jgi:protein-tyrosine phosphatase
MHTAPQDWDGVHTFIKAAHAEGSAVLVHCQRGISRSGATCIAFFMKETGMSKVDAVEVVKSRRPQVDPNATFMRELDEYEAQVRAARS